MLQTLYKWSIRRNITPRLLEALERLTVWLDYDPWIQRPLKLDSWWLKVNHWARSGVGENITVTFSDKRWHIETEDNFFDFLLDLHLLGGVEEDPHGTIVLYYIPTGGLKKKLYFDDYLILNYDLKNWGMWEGLHGAGPDAIPRIVLYRPDTGWLCPSYRKEKGKWKSTGRFSSAS